MIGRRREEVAQMFGKGDPLARDRARGLSPGGGTGAAASENAEAMPQRVETYRCYRGERAFLRDAEKMKSDGWTMEHVRFTPHRRVFGPLDRSRSRMADVHYLR
jgi:hypothetical protein